MIAYIKNHRMALLFIGAVTLTMLKTAMPFYGGYAGIFFLSLFCTEVIRYILIAGYAIAILTSELNRKCKVLTFIAAGMLIAVGLIPTGHFMTLGALLSIQNANPQQIRDDARLLIDEYEAETLFSNNRNQRYPFNNLIPKSQLPLSLQNENLNDVLVLDDYVFIEKFGVTALFRGFIVFREGADIWKKDKAFILLDGCNDCWKIRVIDGLYWYHDVPRDEEIPTFTLPLK